MNKTIIIISIIVIAIFISVIYIIAEAKNNKKTNNIYYKKLFFLRKSELKFLKTINTLENEYIIIPKLYIKKIIKTDKKKYKNELKNITVDYAIFNKDSYQVLLLIELSYKSGKKNNEDKIDKLRKICDDADIKFITFEVNKNNNTDIVDEIKQIIKKNI